MRKIKVLFTIPNFLTAGSGREMFNIIEGIDKNIFEPYIAICEKGGALYEEILSKGYNIIVHDFSAESQPGLYNKIKMARTLARFYKVYGFDIWQSFNWSSDFTEGIVAFLSGAKYVYVKKNMNWNRKAWKIKSVLAKAIVARNTTMLQTMFSGSIYKNKTHYIPGSVDTTRFYKAASNFRTSLGVSADAIVVTCVAQLVKVKDQETLVKAVANINDVFLVLAGKHIDAQYVQQLKELIQQLGLGKRVLLPGNVTDVNMLLNTSDFFVLPTSKESDHEEGCPVALLEAMSAEVPCIASNVAGSSDIVSNGRTGLLFSPGNVGELTQCLVKYIADGNLAKQMAANAKKMITEKYSIDREVKAFEDLYLKLAEA